MDTRDLSVARVKIIALSRIHQIVDDVRRNPLGYRKDTREYCDAMYDIIDQMAPERLTSLVEKLYASYAEMGMAEDGYIADSLMTLALAMYQNEIGERNVYDMGWDRMVEEFFHTTAAV